MKVILLKDIARIGRKFEVKNVPDGHALNHLIPQKLAEIASKGNLKRLEAQSAQIEAEHKKGETSFRELLEKIEKESVEMELEANEKGHLFKGVHAKDIAELLSIDESIIKLDSPIKEVGSHEVALESKDLKGIVRLNIIKKS